MNYHLRFDTRYGFAVGRIRILEKRFLTKQLLGRLVLSASAEEAGRILSEAGYGQKTDAVYSWSQVETLIQKEWHSALELVCQMSRDSVWTDLFRKRIDFHNLRVILRESAIDEPQNALLREGGLVAVETMRNAVRYETKKSLPLFLQNVVNRFRESSKETRDWQGIDILIDRAEFQEWQEVLEKHPNPFLKSWRTLETDLLNLRTFFRLKILDYGNLPLEKMWIPGGGLNLSVLSGLYPEPWEDVLRVLGKNEYGELIIQTIRRMEADRPFSQWERMCQEIRLRFIHMARICGFGVEVLFSYFILKEIEIFAVRSIAVGRANGLSKETIEEGFPAHAFV